MNDALNLALTLAEHYGLEARNLCRSFCDYRDDIALHCGNGKRSWDELELHEQAHILSKFLKAYASA